MELNLDQRLSEMENYLAAEGFVTFHGFFRAPAEHPLAFWDVQRRPDFREYLAAARALGVKLIALNRMEFHQGMLDEARDRLAEAEMPLEDRRRIEKRLRDLRRYEGFTCAIDLTFDHAGRCFIFDLQTDWYTAYLQLSREIDVYAPFDEDDEEDDRGDMFTRN